MTLDSLCVISGADRVQFQSATNHAAYASAHDLPYQSHIGTIPGLKSHYYLKLELARRALERYEWVLWLDHDAFFTNFELSPLASLVEQAKSSGWSFVIGESPVGRDHSMWTRFNSGVFLVRRSPESMRLLTAALSVDPRAEPAAWWREEHGAFFASDQDSLLWAIETLSLWSTTGLVDHECINSRPWEFSESVSEHFVVHFAGQPNRDYAVELFAARFGLDVSLTPAELQVAAGLKPGSPLTRRSAHLRFLCRHPRPAVRVAVNRLTSR